MLPGLPPSASVGRTSGAPSSGTCAPGVEVDRRGARLPHDHMYRVFPELHLDLLCQGPVEKGRDASHGGVEFYNLCVDACRDSRPWPIPSPRSNSASTVEHRLTWRRGARPARRQLGRAGGRARAAHDEGHPAVRQREFTGRLFARRIAGAFTRFVKEKPTPAGSP